MIRIFFWLSHPDTRYSHCTWSGTYESSYTCQEKNPSAIHQPADGGLQRCADAFHNHHYFCSPWASWQVLAFSWTNAGCSDTDSHAFRMASQRTTSRGNRFRRGHSGDDRRCRHFGCHPHTGNQEEINPCISWGDVFIHADIWEIIFKFRVVKGSREPAFPPGSVPHGVPGECFALRTTTSMHSPVGKQYNLRSDPGFDNKARVIQVNQSEALWMQVRL